MKWTTTKIVAAASLGALNLIFALPGSLLNVLTVGPMGGGIINGLIIGPIFIVVTALIVKKPGALTISGLVFSVLAIPLPLHGTPGFLPKILIGPTAGLVGDLLYIIFKNNQKLFAFLGGGATQVVVGLGILFMGKISGIPGMEVLYSNVSKLGLLRLSALTILYITITGAFGLVGQLIYKRLENASVVKRIQG